MSAKLEPYTVVSLDAAEQVALLEEAGDRPTFDSVVRPQIGGPLRAHRISTIQINVGKRCNQTCTHCHVGAGPDRTEAMSRKTFEACLGLAERCHAETVDLTGGAPELNPHFRWFVGEARSRGLHVIDRCNLTITQTPKHGDLAAFLAEHDVEIIASLPHFRAHATDHQRGRGVFDKSIAALRQLNALGYGFDNPRRRLCLVMNPVGPYLPADQASLEHEWKREMKQRYDVSFDALYCITNMPIARFLEALLSAGRYVEYLEQLITNFNPASVCGLMCRSMVSVSWDGRLFDCDFNQMLELETLGTAGTRIDALTDKDIQALAQRTIRTGRHCFGCTAGAGSSCGGATT